MKLLLFLTCISVLIWVKIIHDEYSKYISKTAKAVDDINFIKEIIKGCDAMKNKSALIKPFDEKQEEYVPLIYLITPTYKRPEQVPDLTRLSITLKSVPRILWLVIEDSDHLSDRVAGILKRSGVNYVHLFAIKPEDKKNNPARGVVSRNRGLDWIRVYYDDPRDAIYFADDDNTYDHRLFKEIRKMKSVAMWPVGLISNTCLSSPVVVDGKVIGFYDGWAGKRTWAVDMACFGFTVGRLLEHPTAKMPYVTGWEEDGILKALKLKMEEIEPLADNCTQIFVWHTQTRKNKAPVEVDTEKYNGTNVIDLYDLIK